MKSPHPPHSTPAEDNPSGGGQNPPPDRKDAANPAWKGEAATPSSKRGRARRRYPLSTCETCDAPAVDRHHKDGDPGNNAPENIACLCRRCHMAADGRLSGMPDLSRKRWEKNREAA